MKMLLILERVLRYSYLNGLIGARDRKYWPLNSQTAEIEPSDKGYIKQYQAVSSIRFQCRYFMIVLANFL